MAGQIVVGLYESKGFAQDARNRLHTEGVPFADTSLVVLHEIAAPPPASTQAELAALTVDPLVLGDVENTFAKYIKNGETAVIVNAPTAVDVEFASDILALYDPLVIEVITPRTIGAVK
ncbi:MAG TPA: hypothetical protein VME45_18720 [Stellaceae bacterium]|nr:hypothetical protein [Stellaceae bacterium]